MRANLTLCGLLCAVLTVLGCSDTNTGDPPSAGLTPHGSTGGLLPVYVRGKYGFIDFDGNVVIRPKYAGIDGEHNPLLGTDWNWIAYIGDHARTDIIDQSGRVRWSKKDATVEPLGCGLYATASPHALANRSPASNLFAADSIVSLDPGRAPSPPQNLLVKHGSDGVIIAADPGTSQEGALSLGGEVLINCTFSSIHPFREGLATAMNDDGRFGVIDRHGQWTVQPKFSMVWPYNENAAVVADGTQFYLIDRSGTDLFHGKRFKQARMCSDGRVPVALKTKDGLRWTVVDTSGAPVLQDAHGNDAVLERNYRAIAAYSEGLALFGTVDDEQRTGFLDVAGKEVIVLRQRQKSLAPHMHEFRSFHQGVAWLELRDGRSGWLNRSGHWLWSHDGPAEKDSAATTQRGAQPKQ